MPAGYRIFSAVTSFALAVWFMPSIIGAVVTFPPNGAKDLPADTQIRMTFSSLPNALGTGRVVVQRIADGSDVETLNTEDAYITNSVGGRLFCYKPFSLTGHTLTIGLHQGVLKPDESYRVSVSPGIVLGEHGKTLTEIADGCSWTFSTRPSVQRGRTNLTVSTDGSADFCTLQGAVDDVPDDNSFPVRIQVKNGTYIGLVYLGQGKNHLHVVGESREGVHIEGLNNNTLNPSRVGRALFGVDANDFSLENLTIQNTTPYKGSQAEALRINGEHCVLKNSTFLSCQDTLLLGGSVYVTNCRVEGDVDFIWGEGRAFFESCELRAIHNGYFLQARNPLENRGYVFHQCKLDHATGVDHCLLARIDADRFPNSSVAFINCFMSDCIPPKGWEIKGTNTLGIRFGEYGSRDPSGIPTDVSSRIPESRQLSREEAETLANPRIFFSTSSNWHPY